ncbi:MAG: hypothetical protein Q8N95_13485 [Desulfobacterales bacterium]|nr:hypothetical protein [Desulfobacterales bacterium]
MKNAAYEETKHLKGSAYFKYIHEQVTRDFPRDMFVIEADKTKAASYKISHGNRNFLSPSIAESK